MINTYCDTAEFISFVIVTIRIIIFINVVSENGRLSVENKKCYFFLTTFRFNGRSFKEPSRSLNRSFTVHVQCLTAVSSRARINQQPESRIP